MQIPYGQFVPQTINHFFLCVIPLRFYGKNFSDLTSIPAGAEKCLTFIQVGCDCGKNK